MGVFSKKISLNHLVNTSFPKKLNIRNYKKTKKNWDSQLKEHWKFFKFYLHQQEERSFNSIRTWKKTGNRENIRTCVAAPFVNGATLSLAEGIIISCNTWVQLILRKIYNLIVNTLEISLLKCLWPYVL